MFESNQSRTTPDILKRMARAPFVVFLFVARADGSLDKKEADRLANLMQSDEFAILATAVEQAGTTCDKALLDVMLSSKTTPLDELSELNNLLAVRVSQSNTTDVKVAICEYKVTLLKLARRIAEASGGLLGILGNKIGKEEKAVLDVIAQALGMVPDGELSDAQANPVEIPEEIIFPALRPMAWAEARRGRFAMRSIYEGSDAQSNDPIVAYVIDRAEDVEVISNARLTGYMTIDRLHALAMTNLEKRLLENSKWDETNFDSENETVGTISGLVLHGDYFWALLI